MGIVNALEKKEMVNWEFENVTEITDSQGQKKYLVPLNIKQISELHNSGSIFYDGNIQRGYKTDKNNNLKMIFSTKKVNQIMECLVSHKLGGGLLSLNYMSYYNDEFPLIYDHENKTLSAEKPNIIIDGNHRILSCVRYMKEYPKKQKIGIIWPNPEEFYFPTLITNYDEEKCKTLFAELNSNIGKVSKSRQEFLNVNDLPNNVITYLIENSELHGRVDNVDNTITSTNPFLVTFSTLIQALRNNFSIKTKEEVKVIGEYLIKFFNILINLQKSEMGQIEIHLRNELKTKRMTIESLAWYGYMRLAKELMGESNLVEKLYKLNENNFLDKDNSIWNEIFRETTKGKRIINNSSTQTYVQKVMSMHVLGNEEKLHVL